MISVLLVFLILLGGHHLLLVDDAIRGGLTFQVNAHTSEDSQRDVFHAKYVAIGNADVISRMGGLLTASNLVGRGVNFIARDGQCHIHPCGRFIGENRCYEIAAVFRDVRFEFSPEPLLRLAQIKDASCKYEFYPKMAALSGGFAAVFENGARRYNAACRFEDQWLRNSKISDLNPSSLIGSEILTRKRITSQGSDCRSKVCEESKGEAYKSPPSDIVLVARNSDGFFSGPRHPDLLAKVSLIVIFGAITVGAIWLGLWLLFLSDDYLYRVRDDYLERGFQFWNWRHRTRWGTGLLLLGLLLLPLYWLFSLWLR